MKPSENPRLWTVAFVIVVIALVWFLLPQLFVIVLTALMAFAFYPLYRRLRRKKGYIAAVATVILSYLIVILPLALIMIGAIHQLVEFSAKASEAQYWNMPAFVRDAINTANSVVSSATGAPANITNETVTRFLQANAPSAARGVTTILLNVLANLPGVFIAIMIYTFLFIEFLQTGPQLIAKIKSVSPFGPEVTQDYLENIGLMSNAMLKGQLIISMVISAFGAAVLIPLGYGQYYFILFIIFTILNFIPLGAGILLVPLAVYTMFTGQPWLSILAIALYYMFGGIVEPLLRAHLIPEKVQLSVGITLISAFCGVAYFGMLGVVYGPVIMIVILTTLRFYRRFGLGHQTAVPIPHKTPEK